MNDIYEKINRNLSRIIIDSNGYSSDTDILLASIVMELRESNMNQRMANLLKANELGFDQVPLNEIQNYFRGSDNGKSSHL